MIVIRSAQVDALARNIQARHRAAMCADLHAAQAAHVQGLSVTSLRRHVVVTLIRASRYGIVHRTDEMTFSRLASEQGWRFDLAHDHAWVRHCLLDESRGSITARLRQIAEEFRYRAERLYLARRRAAAYHSLRPGRA